MEPIVGIYSNPFISIVTGHRAHTVYVGVHVPARRSHRRRKHLSQKESIDKSSQDSQERPGEYVKFAGKILLCEHFSSNWSCKKL